MLSSFARLRHDKKRQAYALSAVLALLLILHLLNSQIVSASHDADQVPESRVALNQASDVLARVEVQEVKQQWVQQELQLYGRTAANRIAHIKAALATHVDQIPALEGHHVKAGQLLVELDSMDLSARLAHAQLLVKQRELEYQSAQALEQKGFQAKLFAVEKSTLLAQAKADQARLSHALSHSKLLAPFDGVLDKVMVEQGDWLSVGDPVAKVLELDPLLVKIAVPETQLGQLRQGQLAQVDLLDGRKLDARIRYIASQSHENTNTFDVELSLPNPGLAVQSGISAQVTLFTQAVAASAISPAHLTLNKAGKAGVFVLEQGKARFKPTSVIKSSASQLWVKSLGDSVKVIVAGQQALVDGLEVQVVSELKEAALVSAVR